MTLKLAFAGAGYIARIHARAALSIPGVELAAVANKYEDVMAAFASEFNVPRQYADLESLLEDGGVDAICINTPNYLHAPQAITALAAGVHVMVEKPMALNARDAQAMIDAAGQSGAKLMVAHCWRFDEEVLWLKQQVDAQRLGKIIRTKGYGVHSHWGPSGWFTEARYAGGGALADMGIHAIDAARFLLGDPEPVSVYAEMGTYYGDYDVDDTGVIVIKWDNGAVSYIESGWWQPHSDGPEASTQLYGLQGFGQVFPTRLELPNIEKEDIDIIDSGYPPERDSHCAQAMYNAQLSYFVDCIRSGTDPVPGGKEGLVNMRIVDAAYESCRTGTVIRL
jgi:predicted dehydrogenase